MSLPLFFYLAGLANSLKLVFFVVSIASTISSLLFGAIYVDSMNDEREKYRTPLKWSLIIMGVFPILTAITPSKETMYLMGSSSAIESLAKDERVQTLGKNSLELIEKKIKEYSDGGEK